MLDRFATDRSWPVPACQARAAKQPFAKLAELSGWLSVNPLRPPDRLSVPLCPSHWRGRADFAVGP